jgi:hypothetical protein
MATIKCKRCGAEAYSKNPYTRSVFMNDQFEGYFSNLFSYKVTRPEGKCPEVQFTIKYLASEGSTKSDYELVVRAFKFLENSMKQSPVETLACNHGDEGWEVIEGKLLD